MGAPLAQIALFSALAAPAGVKAQESAPAPAVPPQEPPGEAAEAGGEDEGDFEALPALIQFFRDNGYAFVTIEQMLQP